MDKIFESKCSKKLKKSLQALARQRRALARLIQSDGTILESGKVEYENLIRKGVTVTASKPSTLEKKLRKLCRSGNFETAYELALSAKGYAKDNYYVRLVIDIAEGRKTV